MISDEEPVGGGSAAAGTPPIAADGYQSDQVFQSHPDVNDVVVVSYEDDPDDREEYVRRVRAAADGLGDRPAQFSADTVNASEKALGLAESLRQAIA